MAAPSLSQIRVFASMFIVVNDGCHAPGGLRRQWLEMKIEDVARISAAILARGGMVQVHS